MVVGRQKSIKEVSELERLNKELRLLTSRLVLAEENERRSIAASLHERTNETLVSSSVRLAALARSASDPALAEALNEVRQLIDKLIKETRQMIFEISPPSLYYLGLEAAVRELVDRMAEKYGFQASFTDDFRPKPLDDDVRILLFQAVRELLTNVAKHAQARNVRVLINRSGDNIQIIVQDDGIGLDKADINGTGVDGGFGLFSIRERLRNIEGFLKVESGEWGTRMVLIAPLQEE